jgi:hypothetical protein
MSPNNTPLQPQTTPPADSVSAAEISAFLHQLARLRSPARTEDQADHAERVAVLVRKAELFDRIADQHTGTDQVQARQIAERARTAAAKHTAQLHPTSPTSTPR